MISYCKMMCLNLFFFHQIFVHFRDVFDLHSQLEAMEPWGTDLWPVTLIFRFYIQIHKVFLFLFGTFMISLYLCSVRTIVLTTPLSAGSKTLSPLLHFRSHLFGWLLFFVELSEKLVKCRILNQATFDGNGFVTLK